MGKFAVKLDVVDGVIDATPVAHYAAGESDMAKAVAGASLNDCMINDMSPEYLIPDSVFDIAMSASRRAVNSGVPECHDGPGGRPCGNCRTCMAAEKEAFTRVVLGGVELPGGDLSERIRNAVMSVIGIAKIAEPWNIDYTDEEANEMIDEIMNKET